MKWTDTALPLDSCRLLSSVIISTYKKMFIFTLKSCLCHAATWEEICKQSVIHARNIDKLFIFKLHPKTVHFQWQQAFKLRLTADQRFQVEKRSGRKYTDMSNEACLCFFREWRVCLLYCERRCPFNYIYNEWRMWSPSITRVSAELPLVPQLLLLVGRNLARWNGRCSRYPLYCVVLTQSCCWLW